MRALKRLQIQGVGEQDTEAYNLYGEVWSDGRNEVDGVFLTLSPV